MEEMGKYRFVAKFYYSPSRGTIRINVPKEISQQIMEEMRQRGLRVRTIIVEVEI